MYGSRARGRTFEKRVGSLILKQGFNLRSGVWIGYTDENGTGFAEIDHLVIHKRGLVIVECKLTQTPNAELQITQLYRPLLRHIFPQARIFGVQVCKNIWHSPELPVASLKEVIASDSEDIFTWHCLGRN